MKSELRQIPGVGPNLAKHLTDLGCTTLESLKGQDPESIYQRDCLFQGRRVDRCVLYVYRLAVYYAGHGSCPPGKEPWWNWNINDERGRDVNIPPLSLSINLPAKGFGGKDSWKGNRPGSLSFQSAQSSKHFLMF